MPEQMFTVYLSKTDDLSGLIWTKKIYELSLYVEMSLYINMTSRQTIKKYKT